MAFMFESDQRISYKQRVKDLESKIQRFTKACLSDWPRPIDYTNLIDAQHALKDLKACRIKQQVSSQSDYKIDLKSHVCL